MDERIKAGLKGGIVSWITLILGPLAFLIAGVVAVDFGKASIRNQDDAVVSSLVAGMSCMVMYFIIFVSWSEIVTAILFLPLIAGALSLGGGLLYAKYRLGIPIDMEKLQIPLLARIKPAERKKPLFTKNFCPRCGKKIEKDWKVCPYCKTDIEPVVCPRCGCANPSTAVCCQNCGSPLDGTVIYSDDKTRVY